MTGGKRTWHDEGSVAEILRSDSSGQAEQRIYLAPPIATFSELARQLGHDTPVIVTDAAGHEVAGTIIDISTTTLGLMVKGLRLELHENNVTTVFLHERDSVANGAVFGALITVGFSLLPLSACTECSGSLGAALAIWIPIGAAVGAGVDAMITSRMMIYQKKGGQASVGVAPVLVGAGGEWPCQSGSDRRVGQRDWRLVDCNH